MRFFPGIIDLQIDFAADGSVLNCEVVRMDFAADAITTGTDLACQDFRYPGYRIEPFVDADGNAVARRVNYRFDVTISPLPEEE